MKMRTIISSVAAFVIGTAVGYVWCSADMTAAHKLDEQTWQVARAHTDKLHQRVNELENQQIAHAE